MVGVYKPHKIMDQNQILKRLRVSRKDIKHQPFDLFQLSFRSKYPHLNHEILTDYEDILLRLLNGQVLLSDAVYLAILYVYRLGWRVDLAQDMQFIKLSS